MIELFHSLMLSLPGSPVLYYGDEIGMGDNIHLGDRDAVRTPMQWTETATRASRLRPEPLYLPLITDVVYGFQAMNVESQRQNGGSLLQWVSRMLSVRRDHPQLSIGSCTGCRSTTGRCSPTSEAVVAGGPQPDPVRGQPAPPGSARFDPTARPRRGQAARAAR